MDNMSKKYKCLFIKQPFADEFARGRLFAHMMARKTEYRGEVIICAEDGSGNGLGMYDGAWLARAELVDCIHVKDMTGEQIINSDLLDRKKGYAYILKNARRLVEFPCHGKGFITKVLNEGDMVEYPTLVQLDRKGYEMILTGKWRRLKK